MLEIGALALLVAGGAYGLSLYQKGRAHTRWASLLQRVASSLGGRVSTATLFDPPEMRATVGLHVIDVRLRDTEHPGRGVVLAETRLPQGIEMLRLYVGWDVAMLPRGIEHVPEIPFPDAFGLSGRLTVKASDGGVAHRFSEQAAAILVELRDRSSSRAVEVMCRGGTLTLGVHFVQETPASIERILRAADELAQIVEGKAPTAPSPTATTEKVAPVPAAHVSSATCALCTDRDKPGESWVKCNRCGSTYHHRCWLQATGCIASGCQETRSTPIDLSRRAEG
jgi:hypothetical protein